MSSRSLFIALNQTSFSGCSGVICAILSQLSRRTRPSQVFRPPGLKDLLRIQITCIFQKHVRLRMGLAPFMQLHNRRLPEKWDSITPPFSANGIKRPILQRIPDRISQPVVQNKDVVKGIACRPECRYLPLDFSSVDYGQLVQWSPTHGHGLATDIVVH